jgi:cholesterol oxidase
MTPSDAFFTASDWAGLADWKTELALHYEKAKTMLGAVRNPTLGFVDETLRQCAVDMGVGNSFAPTDVAVYFGEPGKRVSDPYFGGQGPERVGCTQCGACMVGCNVGAKNTLDKNYLFFAEKRGARVFSERKVTRLFPVGERGREGWRVETETSTAWFRKERKTFFVKEVVLAGGVLGTVDLLSRARDVHGTLPEVSKALGRNVRTNGEVFTGVTEFGAGATRDYSRGIAIGSIVKPDSVTSVEPVRYPAGSSFMRLLAGPLVQDPNPLKRAAKFFAYAFTHPAVVLRLMLNPRWAQTSVIFLVMQNLDNRIHLKLGKRLLLGFRRGLNSTPAPDAAPVPSEIPQGNEIAFRFAKAVGGVPQCPFTQVTVNIPVTAHILGGCAIGASAAEGVIDSQHRVFGYEGLRVCDGSAIPANLGVNPSLTICALTERAMSFVLPKVRT